MSSEGKKSTPQKVKENSEALSLDILKQATKEQKTLKNNAVPQNPQNPKKRARAQSEKKEAQPAKRQKTESSANGLFNVVTLPSENIGADGLKVATSWLKSRFFNGSIKRVPAFHALQRNMGQPAPIFLASLKEEQKVLRQIEVEGNRHMREVEAKRKAKIRRQVKIEKSRTKKRKPEKLEKLLGAGITEQVAGIGGIPKFAAGKAGIDDRRGEGGWSGHGEEDDMVKPKAKKTSKKNVAQKGTPKKGGAQNKGTPTKGSNKGTPKKGTPNKGTPNKGKGTPNKGKGTPNKGKGTPNKGTPNKGKGTPNKGTPNKGQAKRGSNPK
eukprot:TRINITY_DN2682_c0_g1_i1.p1 TRINITY_DN2682_c0_g1~~TRINITY_DN2682_c0_g1_i1.p1  ORF type:complete len:325 (-),score=112.82 TRINITY_DN2682_c0_g1_i1:37-1011(-)